MSDTRSNSEQPRRMMYKRFTPEGAALIKQDFERARRPDESLEQTIRRLLPRETEEAISRWLTLCQHAPDVEPEHAALLEFLFSHPEQEEQISALLKRAQEARSEGEPLEQVIRRLAPSDMSDAQVLLLVEFVKGKSKT